MRRLLLPILLVAPLAACGADDAGSAGAIADTGAGVGDVIGADTAGPFDTSPSPDTTPADTSEDAAGDTRGDEVTAALFGLKDDERYLVPGNISPKGDVAAAGDLVAWVEGEPDARTLTVWNVATPNVAPRSFAPPTLVSPRELALSDAYLVYVDDRYGDPDVFAIDLVTGAELTVVALPGAQEAPAVLGSRVAWEDCRACVTGGGGAPGHEDARAVIERDLAGGDEIVRDEAGVADRAPAYGLLGDGRPALAWVSGRATLRLERLQAGASATQDVSVSLRDDQEVAGVAVWEGLIAWRPSPLIVNPDSMIVNPDSMYPSDVMSTDPEDGGTVALTFHAELAWRMEPAPVAVSSRLGWLEIPPGDPATGRVVMTVSGEDPATLTEAGGMTSFAMGRSFVVFSAPRADNDGAEDVHVLPIDLP